MSGFDLRELGWSAELDAPVSQAAESAHADPADASRRAASGSEPQTLGRVAVQHRGGYVAYAADGERRVRLPGRARFDGVDVAVGDWVTLDGDLIRAVLPRRSAIARNAAGLATERQVLAANVDVAFVVSAFGSDLDARRLERYLTVVWDSGAQPVIVLTKADLEPDPWTTALEVEARALGTPVHVVSAVTGEGCDDVRAYLRPGVTGVLLGSSGVGKSTLVNRFAGEALLRTNAVREDDGKGRHTTTHRELVLLPGGGILIDTPGLRELQLWSGDVDEAFADVEELAADCRFSDCSHTREPGCAVLAAVDDGTLPLDRLRSYRKLERELRAAEIRRDARRRREEVRRWRIITRDARERTRRR